VRPWARAPSTLAAAWVACSRRRRPRVLAALVPCLSRVAGRSVCIVILLHVAACRCSLRRRPHSSADDIVTALAVRGSCREQLGSGLAIASLFKLARCVNARAWCGVKLAITRVWRCWRCADVPSVMHRLLCDGAAPLRCHFRHTVRDAAAVGAGRVLRVPVL
jgi:hypothetical protein